MNVQPIRKHSNNGISFGVRILPQAQSLFDRHFAQIARTGSVEDIMLARNYEKVIKGAGNKKGLTLDANSILTADIKNNIPSVKIHRESYTLRTPNEKDVVVLEVNNANQKLTPIQKLKTLAERICKIANL